MSARLRATRPLGGIAGHRGFAYFLPFIALLTLLTSLTAPAHAVGTVLDSGSKTGEKPQSKIFHHDGAWWAIVDGSDGLAFYEQRGSSWDRAQFIDAVLTSGGHADVKWNGSELFVLVYSTSTRLYKYTYDASLRAFNLMSGFPVSVPKPSGSETMVLEQDSTGRLWTTAEGNNDINVYYTTTSDHRTWSGPIVLQSGVGSDDISTIVAFGGNKVGVFWSDQNRDEFGFRVHRDSDPPGTWASKEVADSGNGHADDHINGACDSQGRVFFVTKDDHDEMAVHRRSTSGNWITDANILGTSGTRGILMLDEGGNRLYMLYTRWGVSPHRIEVLESDMDNLNFGSRSTYLSAGGNLNNVTGTKQILPKGTLVAIASTSGNMYWNTNGSLPASSGPSAPQGLVAALGGSQVELSWNTPSSGSPIGYNVYRQVGGGSWQRINNSIVGTRSFTDTAPPEDALCYRVTAVDGSESAPSNVDCVDNTPAPAPGQPLNLTSEALAGNAAGALSLPMDEGIDQVAGDLSGNGNDARLGSTTLADSGDPTWITGVNGGALHFDGIDDYLYVAHHSSLNMSGGFTIEAWVRQDAAITGSILNKGVSGDTNYRMLANASGGIEFRWEDANATRFELITPPALTIGKWQHVACVYDDVASENRVYVDGVLVASGAAFGVPAANTYQLHVGTRLSSTLKEFWEGAIDEVRITPGALYTTNFLPQTNGANGSTTMVRLQWQAPVSGGTAVGYNVFRSINNGAFAQLNTSAVGSTSFIDADLQIGALCYYVEAMNAQSVTGPPSNTTCENITPGPPPPAAPTQLAVILAGSVPENALLTWDAPTSGATATGYFIYRAVENNPYELLNNTPVSTTSFTDTALLSGNHCYRVSAVDTEAREGELSTAQCVSYQPPPPPLPEAATNLMATLSTQAGSVSEGTAAWSFDELSGQTAADATGHGNTGRLGSTTGDDANDPLWAPGFTGNSLFFDGSNDYVEVPDSPDLKFTGSFTLEAWVKRASSGTQVVLAKGDSDQRNYWMRVGSTGIVNFRWETANGSNHGTATSATVSVGEWHHLACVYDAQASESRIYIDGKLEASQSETGTPTTSTDPLQIGVRLSSGSKTDYFHGNIDLVRVSPDAIYNADFTPPTEYASDSQTIALLDWTASPSGTVVGYNVYRSVAQSPMQLMNTSLVTDTNWTDTMTLNDSLCYEVRAVDFAAQLSAPSNTACVYIAGPPPAAPGAPLSLMVTKQGTNPESMLLQWLAPTSGSPVGYHVERRIDAGSWLRLTTAPQPALQYTDDSSLLGDICYRVFAEDAFQQESPASNEACDSIAAPPAPPAPGAPDTLLTTFLGTEPESIELTWPASNSGLPAVGYNIYRQVNGGSVELQADSITTTTWVDSLLLAGDLCYQVAAFDSLGREGDPTGSSCLSYTPPLGAPPSEPLNVTAILMATSPTKATATTAEASSDTTTMGAWGFDEGSGDDIGDSSGQGHDGYLGNSVGTDSKDPTWVAGLDGMALQFDGTQNATIDDAPGLRHAGSFTVEAWIYRTSDSGSQVVLSKGDSNQRNYWLRITSSGSVDFRWETASGANHGSSSSGIVPLNEWHHVACVYDMSAGENRIYIDGVLDGTTADSGTPTTSADPVLIGTRLSGGTKKDYFVGSIDMARVSSSARYTADFTPDTSFGPSSSPASQQMVQLNWEAPAQGVPAGYRIYRSIDGAPQQVMTSSLVTEMTWNDLNPVIGLLTYNVSAVDAFGQEGPQSTDSTSVQVDDGTPPPPPAPSAPQLLIANLVQLPGGSGGAAAFPLVTNSGQIITDASGNGNDGMLGTTTGLESSDPLWTTGVTGSALLFDGVNDLVTIPDAPQLQMSGSFTIEAWVYRASAGKSMIVLSKGDSNERNYWMRIGTTGSIDFRWESGSGANHGTKSTATMQLGQWQHVACVYDQEAGRNRIYLDGIMLEDDPDSGTPVTSNSPLYLGARLSSGRLKEYHDGMIDLVRISSGAIYTDNFTPPTGFGSGAPITVAQLSWGAPASGIASSYNVYRSVGSGPWEKLNNNPVAQLTFTDDAPLVGENCYQVSAVDGLDQEGELSSSTCITHVATKVAALQPTQQDLWDGPRFAIHPNPFNPQTRIEFRLPDEREVRLELFDVRGRHVATLARGVRSAGHHIVRWDGREDRGTRAGTGTYFLVLQAGDIHETRKMILVK